jgi:hypothetical protein
MTSRGRIGFADAGRVKDCLRPLGVSFQMIVSPSTTDTSPKTQPLPLITATSFPSQVSTDIWFEREKVTSFLETVFHEEKHRNRLITLPHQDRRSSYQARHKLYREAL